MLFILIPIFNFSFSKNSLDDETKDQIENKDNKITEIDPVDDIIFYVAPSNFNVIKNLKTDYNVDNSFDTDDSSKMQQTINDISNAGGGKLIISSGNYSFAQVHLNSNVHIEVDSGATIRPANRNYNIFYFSSFTEKPIKNVGLVGVNGSFTVDLTKANNKNLRVGTFQNISTFLVKNLNVNDDFSKFTVLEFNGLNLLRGYMILIIQLILKKSI